MRSMPDTVRSMKRLGVMVAAVPTSDSSHEPPSANVLLINMPKSHSARSLVYFRCAASVRKYQSTNAAQATSETSSSRPSANVPAPLTDAT